MATARRVPGLQAVLEAMDVNASTSRPRLVFAGACEHPACSSKMLLNLGRRRRLHEGLTPLCAWGAPYRRNTRIVSTLPAITALSCRCSCSRSHVSLGGFVSFADRELPVALSDLACRLPPALCRAIAEALADVAPVLGCVGGQRRHHVVRGLLGDLAPPPLSASPAPRPSFAETSTPGGAGPWARAECTSRPITDTSGRMGSTTETGGAKRGERSAKRRADDARARPAVKRQRVYGSALAAASDRQLSVCESLSISAPTRCAYQAAVAAFELWAKKKRSIGQLERFLRRCLFGDVLRLLVRVRLVRGPRAQRVARHHLPAVLSAGLGHSSESSSRARRVPESTAGRHPRPAAMGRRPLGR